MYISTKSEFLTIKFLGDIEGAISNRDSSSKNLLYRQSIVLYTSTDTIKCSFETITDKEDFSGIFSFYTFDRPTNRVMSRYFTYYVIPIE